ncbi:MAG TPA: alkaline phosphatase family protein [Candidatus Dormibacteraeota bacterium]|nr:alkaline phosphatase family protein [Candidatus Dormibacteraeota bacterium]
MRDHESRSPRRFRPGALAAVLLPLLQVTCPAFVQSNALSQSNQSAESATAKSEAGKKKEEALAAAHHFDRILIIVLENVDYERAIQDPSLMALAAQGASFTNFHALFHPSYPNYLAMIAGTDFGIHRRGSFLGDKQVNFPNDAGHKTIADRLIAAGLDFKQYAEELPDGTCPWDISGQHVADKRGNYVRRHVPFLSFREIQEKWCDHVIRVDSGKSDNYFARDANQGLVAYSFYTPNMNHDGHDTTAQVAGGWVKKFLDESFQEKLRKGTLVVITFDESGGNEDNRIYTLFLGDMVKPASQQDPAALGKRYNHYSVLRTIEDNFGLEPLTVNDRDAKPITDIWK